MTSEDAPAERLPQRMRRWFDSRGWQPRAHQLALLQHGLAGRSTLLIAPTGAGKTLAGFLPTLVELCEGRRPAAAAPASTRARLSDRWVPLSRPGIHTLYVSPLKALAVDIARNLVAPITEMGLPIRVETRTGDTPPARRRRQKSDPPDVLLTTPEQLALLIASREAPDLFASLRRVVIDELHALVTSKRGDLLCLGLARLRHFVPDLQVVGLSATVADPDDLARWLVPQKGEDPQAAEIVFGPSAAAPDISILKSQAEIPWAGHTARYALQDIYAAIAQHRLTLLFVNTRSQAELLFQELWHINERNLRIALHHGSLDVAQRRRVEAAMAAGRLDAVVATSTLDLGIDWGDVDLVINVGAPKGASRLAQRIGRANHRLDEPSKAILVPSNRFEVLECEAALEAAREGAQDTPPARRGGLDVLAQHVLGIACSGPFDPDALYAEVASLHAYRWLTREEFDRVVDFVATGGYALRAYERYARLKRLPDGRFRLAHPRFAEQYRLNVGTIVEAPMLKVRLVRGRGERRGRATGPIGRGGRLLGHIEEGFIEQLSPGDSFLFAGEVLRFEALVENEVYASRSRERDPAIPSYQGGKFPLSTYLADRVRAILSTPESWRRLPEQVRDWLELQRGVGRLPGREGLLVETFPRGDRFYLVCYPFEGRLAHQTLGMLLTRRLERARARPLGFVANEYALAVWGLADIAAMVRLQRLSLDALFAEDMLGDDLDAWLAGSSLMKRTFRNCAVIAGLIERRHPGREKTGRQITVSSDLIYDVLAQHEPDHILLRATWQDVATGLIDAGRLAEMLRRIRGRIVHTPLDHVSPLAVPVLLEIGREPVHGEAREAILAENEEEILAEAFGERVLD